MLQSGRNSHLDIDRESVAPPPNWWMSASKQFTRKLMIKISLETLNTSWNLVYFTHKELSYVYILRALILSLPWTQTLPTVRMRVPIPRCHRHTQDPHWLPDQPWWEPRQVESNDRGNYDRCGSAQACRSSCWQGCRSWIYFENCITKFTILRERRLPWSCL